MTKTSWLIWSNEHNAWWRADGIGYTHRVDHAGRYGFSEALHICRRACLFNDWTANKPLEEGMRMSQAPNEVMVPAPEMIAAIEGSNAGGGESWPWR